MSEKRKRRYADLRHADLSRASFYRADVIGADLRGADVTGAYFVLAKLAWARWVDGTECLLRGD
jgi:uncharacterized protein YjbI with pentapeptide repeats